MMAGSRRVFAGRAGGRGESADELLGKVEAVCSCLASWHPSFLALPSKDLQTRLSAFELAEAPKTRDLERLRICIRPEIF